MYNVVKRDGHEVAFNIERICSAIQKAFDALGDPLDYEYYSEQEIQNYRLYIRILAELGWPAFLEDDPLLHEAVISYMENGDADGIKETLYNYFDVLFIKDLQDRIEESHVISPLRVPPIKEALLLYQLGYYYGAVAILVTQIEGIISDVDDYVIVSGHGYSEKNLALLRSLYNVSDNKEKGRAIKAILEAKSISDIAGEYDRLIGYLRAWILKDKPTDDELREHANRHAICHGRQCNYGTKEHALKTILYIDALEHIADIIASDTEGQPVSLLV